MTLGLRRPRSCSFDLSITASRVSFTRSILQPFYTMIVNVFEETNLTSYHRIDVDLRQGDCVIFEKLSHTDLSIFASVTSVCIYSLYPRDIPQPTSSGCISVLKELPRLSEFSFSFSLSLCGVWMRARLIGDISTN